MLSSNSLLLLLSFTASIVARTDLTGCTSTEYVVNGGASLAWYVPDSGEICAPLDCGGGRAPPKTTVPGCAAYEGTETYKPSYIPGWGPDATPPAETTPEAMPTESTYHPIGTPSEMWPSSTLATMPSSTASSSTIGTTTATLGLGKETPTSSLLTQSLLIDTSALEHSVTNMITVTSSSIAQQTANAAVETARAGNQMIMAAMGAVAGLALL